MFVYNNMMTILDDRIGEVMVELTDFLGSTDDSWSVAFKLDNFNMQVRGVNGQREWTLTPKERPCPPCAPMLCPMSPFHARATMDNILHLPLPPWAFAYADEMGGTPGDPVHLPLPPLAFVE